MRCVLLEAVPNNKEFEAVDGTYLFSGELTHFAIEQKYFL